jgi:hypothetical protein
MEARKPVAGPVLPPPLRLGAEDQAAATLDLLRTWAAENPAYDRETWRLLEQSLHEEPLALWDDDDRADRLG